MSDKKAIDQGISEIYDLVWGQFKEDRDAIKTIHQDIKDLCVASPERYAVLGDSLAKYADLMTKQTGQVIELLKIVQKNKEKEEGLTAEDLEEISRQISKNDE